MPQLSILCPYMSQTDSWTYQRPASQLWMAQDVHGQVQGCVSVPYRGAYIVQGDPVLLVCELTLPSWALLRWIQHERAQIRWKVCTSSQNFAYVALCDSRQTDTSQLSASHSQGVHHTRKRLRTVEEVMLGRWDLRWHCAVEVLGDKDHRQYWKELRE